VTLNKAQAAAEYAASRHQKLSALLLGTKGLPPLETPSPVLSMTSTLHSSPHPALSEASTAVADISIDDPMADTHPSGRLPTKWYACHSALIRG
jgi:hypothetical protein